MTSLLIVIISVIVTMFNMGDITDNVPTYGFILPTLGYVMLVLMSSYYSSTVAELFKTNYGFCLVWLFIESILFIIIGILID